MSLETKKIIVFLHMVLFRISVAKMYPKMSFLEGGIMNLPDIYYLIFNLF